MTINGAVIILDAAQESSSWGKMMMIQISHGTVQTHFLKTKHTTHPGFRPLPFIRYIVSLTEKQMNRWV